MEKQIQDYEVKFAKRTNEVGRVAFYAILNPSKEHYMVHFRDWSGEEDKVSKLYFEDLKAAIAHYNYLIDKHFV